MLGRLGRYTRVFVSRFGVAEDANTLKFIADAIARVEELLGYVPGDAPRELRAKISTLRGIILEQRPPAVVLIGRRGAGKSSLINALLGARVAGVGHVSAQTGRGRWFECETKSGSMWMLDTRGVQEGSSPAEGDASPDARGSILLELQRRAPDVVIFVVKGSEVDAAIDGDIAALDTILLDVERVHRRRPPILAVLTHCDLFEPKALRLDDQAAFAPDEVDEKLSLIALAERQLEAKLRTSSGVGNQLARTLGVSAYLSFRTDGTVRADERWRIDELTKALFEALPDAGRGVFARLARHRGVQDDIATSLTRATAALCGALAALPVPVPDLVPITAMQVSLIAGIAWLSGRKLEPMAAAEFLTGLGVNVGAAFLLREAARALTKFVFPGAGAAVSGTVAFAGTMAIGAAARAYFIGGSTMEQARATYERAKTGGSREEPEAGAETPAEAPSELDGPKSS